MSFETTLAELDAERAIREARRAEDWAKALDKLSVTFEAGHGGGYPDCLKGKKPMERLSHLRSIGFRVREQYDMPADPVIGPEVDQLWAVLSGGIAVCLTDGFVCQRGKGWSEHG